MLNVNAKIKISDGEPLPTNIVLETNDINTHKNEISSNISSVVNNNKKNATRPFIIGQSKIGDGSTIHKKVNFYLGNEFVDSATLYFKSKYVIKLSNNENKPFKNVSIIFDSVNNGYPNILGIRQPNAGYKQFFVFSSKVIIGELATSINLKELENNTEISFDNWNNRNQVARIEGIYSGETLELDRISFNVTHKDRSKNDEPSYGVIANSGNIEYFDQQNDIKYYNDIKFLLPNQQVELILHDSLTNKQQVIGSFQTDKWNYDVNNFKVNIQLKDITIKLQNIFIKNFVFNEKQTLWDYYDILTSNMPQDMKLIIDDSILNTFTSIKLPNGYIDETFSLWDGLNQLCYLTQLHCYSNLNGYLVLGE